jgi:hypothetical protein
MKFYTRFWKNPEYLTNFWVSDYWSCTDGTRGSSCHTRRCLRYFGHNSFLRTTFWAICWKAYEIIYKFLKKSWAFEQFLSVGWTDGSVGSSGASLFCVNTSLYVSWKSIGWTDAFIRWYHHIIRCLYTSFILLRSSSGAHKNGTVGSSYALFSAHLNLGITFHYRFWFWWSWTLWKACGIILMIM